MTYSQTLVAHDDILIGHCTIVHINRAPINPTLPHLFGIQVVLPSHDLPSQFHEKISCQRFGPDVGELICCIYRLDLQSSRCDSSAKMMHSTIDVFSPWSHFWDGCHCLGTLVVFKHGAPDAWWGY